MVLLHHPIFLTSQMPPLYFPHVNHLSGTPSPYFCGPHHRTVTLPLFLLPLLPAWLKVQGGKWFPASAVPHLQINSVSIPVKYACWRKPKQVTYTILSTWTVRFTLKLRRQQFPFQYMERKLEVSNAWWGAQGWQPSCPPVNEALPGPVTWKHVAASLLPLTLPYSPAIFSSLFIMLYRSSLPLSQPVHLLLGQEDMFEFTHDNAYSRRKPVLTTPVALTHGPAHKHSPGSGHQLSPFSSPPSLSPPLFITG